jgi:hypothetical protein
MDQHDLYLLPVHIAMILMVIGFFTFFFMVAGGMRKTIKVARKAKKKAKKIMIKLQKKEEFKKNWAYDI